MKSVIFAAAMAIGATSAAHAGEWAMLGETEYAVEADVFSLEAGAEYAWDKFRVTGMLNMDNDTISDEFDFTGADVEFGYQLSENIEAYARVELDDGLEYSDVVIGATFRF